MFGSKGLMYERLAGLLSLLQFAYEGSLEFCICDVIKLLMLNQGLFIYLF